MVQNLGYQNLRGRAGIGFDVVVFGNPVTLKAQLFSEAGFTQHGVNGLPVGLAFAYRHKA